MEMKERKSVRRGETGSVARLKEGDQDGRRLAENLAGSETGVWCKVKVVASGASQAVMKACVWWYSRGIAAAHWLITLYQLSNCLDKDSTTSRTVI
jgi:hypothetical protein